MTPKHILITGGCGFIGRNATERFLSAGASVTVVDNLSRRGAERNLGDLKSRRGFHFESGDVRDQAFLCDLFRRGSYDTVLHLAGQVAVTTSMLDPRLDFEVNAAGTLNLLEAVRLHSPDTIFLNASTNKVYGSLSDLRVVEEASRYTLPDAPEGVSESRNLDFHSPYGCSKGAADQYVIDYGRCFGIRTLTFRQSCIYGFWQFGIEDQGWVAWFIIAHLLQRPITVFGTGKQVRDVLFVDDLIDCYFAAVERIDSVAGTPFNVGGGPENTLSLLELIEALGRLSGRPVAYAVGDSRVGDQPVFVSDIARAKSLLGWSPRTKAADGIEILYKWIEARLPLFQQEQPPAEANRAVAV